MQPAENKPGGEIILFQTEDAQTRLQVRLEGQTVWLSLNQIADLFQRDKSVISKHLKNIFEEGELSAEATIANFATVQTEGEREVSRNIEFYNLDAILAVGCRQRENGLRLSPLNFPKARPTPRSSVRYWSGS